MDSAEIPFAEFDDCLIQLERINVLTLAYRPTLKWIGQMLAKSDQPLSVLDIGSGGGDMLRRIAALAKRKKRQVQLTGVDINPWSAQSALAMTPHSLPITFETSDIFAFDAARRSDIIISSLFTHHLNDDEIIRFIQWMENHATHGWCINDLHRHTVPFYFIKFAVRLFSRNRLIVHDAPVSVARSFTRKDWENLLTRAGVSQENIRIRWFFPFRYAVFCERK